MHRNNHFLKKDDGLVTIEWVAIAAVAFVASVTIAGTLLSGASNLGGSVADQMNAAAGEGDGEGDPQ